MAVSVGTQTQYDDVNSIIEPEILAFAEDIQLGAYEGKILELSTAPIKGVTRQRFEIGSRSRTALTGVIGDGAGTGWADGTTTAALPMTEDQIAILTIGMVLKVESEIVVVESIDRTAFTIDVYERGAGNTSGAAHVDQVAYSIVGNGINDTDAKNVEAIKEQTEPYINYTQLLFVPVEQTEIDSHEDRKFFLQEQVSMNEQLRREALDRVFRMLSSTIINGVKRVGTDSIPPLTAGILDQLQDTSGGERTPIRYNVNGDFTEDKLKAALDVAFQTGQPDVIALSPTNKKVLNPIIEQFVRMGKMEAKRAGTDNVLEYEYENIVLKIVQDSGYPNDRVSLLTSRDVHSGWKVKDPIRWVDEPKASSRENRNSYQGNWFTSLEGVGRDHVDMYGVT